MYKNSYKKFTKSRGFSLIELIVAIVVLSLGLTGVLLAFNYAVRGSADPVLHKQALSIAEEKISECRMLEYTDAKNQCSGVKTDERANGDELKDIKVEIVSSGTEICRFEDPDFKDCKDAIDIKVKATPKNSSNHSVVLHSYRTNWNQ